jgi:hypothetical protein
LSWLLLHKEAICERFFKWAKRIGTAHQMARLLDETFEMLVMAQYKKIQFGTGT